MSMEWQVAGVVVLAFGTVSALVAITTGRVAQFSAPRRGTVFRPRLWGYGTLIALAGMGTFLFLGPYQGPAARHFGLAMAGMAVFFAGLIVQYLSRRPRRTSPTPTKSAS
ncbi:hypothetical protein [Streptomyces sp. NPDC057616]|uniref:hypothetical protein n=1 Tax=Streptomyces sp. NPDC057616 TaxID=3346183 RepID=UPI00368A3035